MANFLEIIFAQLEASAERVVLREIHGERFVSVTGRELLEQVQHAREYLRGAGVRPGDRCALPEPPAGAARGIAWSIIVYAETAARGALGLGRGRLY